MLLVKTGHSIGFCVHRRSYSLRSPVIARYYKCTMRNADWVMFGRVPRSPREKRLAVGPFPALMGEEHEGRTRFSHSAELSAALVPRKVRLCAHLFLIQSSI